MKNLEYNIPVFESEDIVDLNLYSENMAEAIKDQIDKFGNPLTFQGIKERISELNLILNPQNGDIYGIIETNKNYIWNGKEWVVYSDVMELDNYYNRKEIDQKIENIQALPVGGTKGQVLTKQSETNGDANWEDIEANEVFVGNEEEAPSSAKIIVEEDDFLESSTLSKAEVYVGAEEPTTGEKVWFRKGNNLLDKSKFIFNKSLNVDTGTVNVSTSGNWYAIEEYIYFKQYAGKTISLSNRLSVAFYDSNKKYISSIVARINPTGIVPTNAVYIRADVYKDYYDVVQLEIGNTPTEYQPYVKPQIFIKNSNGLYEEFTTNNVISGQVTATTDNVGRILVPIPLGATGANVISVEGDYFTFLRPLQSNKTNSLCYLKDTDNMKAIANTSVTVVWSYIK